MRTLDPAARVPAIVLSCEHACARVPSRYERLFAGSEGLLRTHRGYDAGALEIARHLARRLGAPLVIQPFTRLLADANRSRDNPRLLSRWTRALPAEERALLVERVWRPFRDEVEARVRAGIARRGRCLHVSVHTFTPVLRGTRRDVDVGLLYDPSRPVERALAGRMAAALRAALPRLRVCRNRPYRGTGDGFTSHLRRIHPARAYAGLELETSQRFPRAGGARWRRLEAALLQALSAAVEEAGPLRWTSGRGRVE